MSLRASELSSFRAFVSRCGVVLAAWIVALAIEHLVIGLGYRRMFVAPFEMGVARTAVSPLVVVALVPCAAACALLLQKPTLAPFAFSAFGALVAWGVSSGRHMQSPGVRIPFIVAVGAIGFAAGKWAFLRVLGRAEKRPRRSMLALFVAGCALWCVDAFVLPRLYPAFHHGVFALALFSIALAAWLVRDRFDNVGLAAIVLAALCAAWTPFGIKALWRNDNLRMVLVDHAPMLGRGVRIAVWIWPRPEAAGESVAFTEIARSLDWTGRDIVLISVDALRADHVGAYGYARRTTPHIDALAAEGAIFDAAYCATPHTSYSITSMLTGKYIRPLLALGLGDDSLTLASYLRTYGYRTAAFYPPAVFFIDEHKLRSFEDRALDFEYRKVEFASPSLRREQVRAYLDAPEAQGKPIFLWVHYFEPHEPYVMHPEHPFGEKATDLDAYDSEIAAADEGIGWIVEEVRKRRPEAVFVVTADHGEEFGEHGGRYHGTTVYEEQVRVPLVVAGAGVVHARIRSPVQTIDIVPTVLSALGVPRPARVRGRDIGPLLSGKGSIDDPGFAFAETDDQTLVAERDLRLVCARRAGACALYDVRSDPAETRDLTAAKSADAARLKGTLVATAKSHGQYEGQGTLLPEALRRGLQGDVEADMDVAALLDDANLEVRRKAAQALYDLKSKRVIAQLRRAEEHDEDEAVRRWCALALVRAGETDALGEKLLGDPDIGWRRLASLAFADKSDPRGDAELAAWWSSEGPPRGRLDFLRARDLLRAIGVRKVKAAVLPLAESLSDVRMRPYVAQALGAIGDASARGPLLRALGQERYANARLEEARALVLLGAKDELRDPLALHAAVTDPMTEAIALARDAGALDPKHGGWSSEKPVADARAVLTAPEGPARLWVLLGDGVGEAKVSLDGKQVILPPRSDDVRYADLDHVGARATVEAHAGRGILALWLVRRTP